MSPREISLYKHAGVTGYTGQEAISFEAEAAMFEEPLQEQTVSAPGLAENRCGTSDGCLLTRALPFLFTNLL